MQEMGEQGARQPSGGSNASGLAEEAGRAKGLSSLLAGASAQGEGTPDAKLWGARREWERRVVFEVISLFRLVVFVIMNVTTNAKLGLEIM